MIEYDSILDASKNCVEISKTKPSAIEFVDKTTLNQIKFKFNKNTKCLLFVEYDNNVEKKKKKLKLLISGKIIQKLSNKK